MVEIRTDFFECHHGGIAALNSWGVVRRVGISTYVAPGLPLLLLLLEFTVCVTFESI